MASGSQTPETEVLLGRWSYYSPLWLGALLIFLLHDALRGLVPKWPAAAQWTLVSCVALASAILSQVLLVGAQGAFAQVLPVPGGRSIRGGAAVLGGWLLIGWVLLSAVAAMLGSEGLPQATTVVGAAAGCALLAFALVYFWNIPAAVDDFGGTDRPRGRGF